MEVFLEDKIKANAELVVKQLGPLSGFEFGYNADSVAWVDGFIDSQRSRTDIDKPAIDGLVNMLGSFLGESIIQCFGGKWCCVDGQWCVSFSDKDAAYPFNRVSKQFAYGAEYSIKTFFEQIPVLFKDHIKKNQAAEDQLKFFIQQAEEAYGRIYDAYSGSDRAAAYNDCKESMADAIGLARTLGLTEKVAELEKKLEHYKAVFRSQMNF
jgi:hypothetical protein